MDLTVDQRVDCRGLLCPTPVVKVIMAIKKMQIGQVLEVLATDPGSRPDIEAWTKQTGHELLSYREADGVYVFHVRRTR